MPKEDRFRQQTTIIPREDIKGNVHAYSYSHSFGSPRESAPETPSSYAKSEIISDSIGGGVDETQQLPLPQQLKTMLEQPPGVKLIAHGTKCRPRPVYLTLHSDTINSQSATTPEYRNCLTWRAELKSSSSPLSSNNLNHARAKMGNLRKVELNEILGFELGKRTTALRRVQTARMINECDCFSLLTKTGTLDLECTALAVGGRHSSAEEVRAAFIMCLAMAVSSRGLRMEGLHPPTTPSLQAQLRGLNLNTGSPPTAAQWDEGSLFSGLMSAKTISTVSF